MTAERVYLTVAEVVAIHHYQIEEYGAESGLLNQGALESAVFRPQTGYYNDLSEEAAALLESLVNNHLFEDGNKRGGICGGSHVSVDERIRSGRFEQGRVRVPDSSDL